MGNNGTQVFQDLLEKHIGISIEKQLAFMEIIEGKSYNWDLEATQITFGNDIKFPIQVIGTIGYEAGTWLNSLENKSFSEYPNTLRAAKYLREFGERYNVPELINSEFEADNVFSQTMGLLVVGILKTTAYYISDYGKGSILFVINERENEEEIKSPVFIGSTLMEMTNITYKFNHRNAIKNYLEQKGFSIREADNEISGINEKGTITIRLDDSGRYVGHNMVMNPKSDTSRQTIQEEKQNVKWISIELPELLKSERILDPMFENSETKQRFISFRKNQNGIDMHRITYKILEKHEFVDDFIKLIIEKEPIDNIMLYDIEGYKFKVELNNSNQLIEKNIQPLNTTMKHMTLHYVFAHRELRNIVLRKPDYFIKAYNSGSENLKEYLKYIWNMAKEFNPDLRNNDIEISKDSFDVSISEPKPGKRILNIIMPEISEAPEAMIVGILLDTELRYFTLEYENNEIRGESFMVCEWKKDGQHANYGVIDSPTVGVFTEKIGELLLN